jgi:hypothetical protein
MSADFGGLLKNPTAYTPCGVCCARSTGFQQSEPNQ